MTPEEKLHKQQRSNIEREGRKLTMQFSIGRIKTYGDVYKLLGYTDNHISKLPHKPDEPIKFDQLKSFIADLANELEAFIAGKVAAAKAQEEAMVAALTPAPVPRANGLTEKLVVKLPESFSNSTPVISTAIAQTPDESGYTNDNNYGLVPSSKETAFLYYFQKKAAAEALDGLTKHNLAAQLVLAATGTGKTFIAAAIARRILDMKFTEGKTWGQTHVLFITRATVVEQTKRVFQNFFGLRHPVDVEVINIEQLRSRAGQLWIQEKRIIVNGEEEVVYEWKPMINPVVILWDECQALKNEGSIQHKIGIAFSEIKTPVYQFFISATPFTRVSEAKAFAIATRKDISHITGIPGQILSTSNWPTYAGSIAGSQSSPEDYNEAAVERLMKDLDNYIVRVKGVRWQFNAINQVRVINFDAPALKNDFTDTELEYRQAWEKYLEMMAKMELAVTDNPRFQALVQLGQFLKAAEYSKRYILAERMMDAYNNGYAAVCAVKFKATIIAIVKILNEKYKVPRDVISLVWGGGQTALTQKQKLKAKIRENEELFKTAGISMDDMGLDDVEDRILEDLPEHLRLGSQSKEERQREIDRFQSGKAFFAIYTYKAGGVGLSLHHTDEQTTDWNRKHPEFEAWYNKLSDKEKLRKGKVRRKANGYAIEEDIKFIPVRPRKAIIGPTWSAIELVQGCGRCPRLTSLSNTEQDFLYYKGTVEEDQAFVVTHKLKCLTKVVRQHESWQDLITNHSKSKELARQMVSSTESDEKEQPDNDELVSDVGEENEE